MHVAWARHNASDFLPCGDRDAAATMPAHFVQAAMNRTIHLQARSASGAAWLSACGIVGGMGKRLAGQPAARI